MTNTVNAAKAKAVAIALAVLYALYINQQDPSALYFVYIEQAAMTGLHDEPITAVSVADNTSKSGMLRPS